MRAFAAQGQRTIAHCNMVLSTSSTNVPSLKHFEMRIVFRNTTRAQAVAESDDESDDEKAHFGPNMKNVKSVV